MPIRQCRTGYIPYKKVKMKFSSFLPFLFILTGCGEDFSTYSSFCESEKTVFTCLHYVIEDTQEKQSLIDAFHLKDTATCPFTVSLIKYHVGKCDNPLIKSRGSDFYGYIRVEVKKGFKCYYKIQSNYKVDVERAFERVLKKVKTEYKY